MQEITTIYVRLVDEDVLVRRPVEAERIGEHVYLIAAQPYDREIEEWEFQPGDRVICEVVTSSEGPVLVAVRLAPPDD